MIRSYGSVLGDRMSGTNTAGGDARDAPAPLYERLPHGPHRLRPQDVTRNQRKRLHGAMVEAVAINGYEGTSVKQVVGLAGVSRRSFYEQFANKQECFLATFDLIAARGAGRVSAAYRAAGGETEERMQVAFGALGEAISSNWKSARFVILEAPKVGAPALLRLRRASATFEQMLSGCFEQASAASPLPVPVIRGIAGGLHAALSQCLREGTAETAPAVAEEMFRWTLLFQTPAARGLAERLAERARAALAQGRKPAGAGTGRACEDRRGERERLLDHALRLAIVEDYHELSAPQIADAAGVPVDAFFELFDGKHECFLAALDMLGEELIALASDPSLRSGDWPHAVRLTIRELMRYLAERPIYAQTIAGGSFAAGPDAIERNVRLAQSIAALLTEGAPATEARSPLLVQGVAGALSHTVRCQVASGQIQLLSVLSDYLTYIVLAPFVGAQEAATLVIERAA
jgi:AcrR family transcriptional regulator